MLRNRSHLPYIRGCHWLAFPVRRNFGIPNTEGCRNYRAGRNLRRGFGGNAACCRRRIRDTIIGNLQRGSQVIRRAFGEVIFFGIALRQQHLATRRQLDIMWNMQVFQDLLRHSLKNRRGDLSALMQTYGRIQYDRHRDRGIVDGGKARE